MIGLEFFYRKLVHNGRVHVQGPHQMVASLNIDVTWWKRPMCVFGSGWVGEWQLYKPGKYQFGVSQDSRNFIASTVSKCPSICANPSCKKYILWSYCQTEYVSVMAQTFADSALLMNPDSGSHMPPSTTRISLNKHGYAIVDLTPTEARVRSLDFDIYEDYNPTEVDSAYDV